MLIPLILYSRNALSRPMFYMSGYLERNREEYYDRLLRITSEGDWHGWLQFFLNAIATQAEMNLDKVRDIRTLYENTHRKAGDIIHSRYAPSAIDAFFRSPILSSSRFADAVGFNNKVTANSMLRQLESGGVIRRIRRGGGRTAATYALTELIDIAEGRPVFR